MAAVDAAALAYLRRHRTVRAWLQVCALGGLLMAVLAAVPPVLFGPGRSRVFYVFGGFHLAAYGIFLHGPAVLVGSAWLLRRSRWKTAMAAAGLAVVLVAVGVDAFYVEPTWLQVSRIELATAKVDRPLRIVVLADLQTDEFGPYQREVFRRVMDEEPDLILLAGDYFQAGRNDWETLRGALSEFLDELGFSAPGGVFAIRGNIEPDRWPRIFEGLPVATVESTRSFELSDLRLTCLSERDSFDTSLELPHDEADRFHLVLGHSPNYARGRIEADLLVAGHTHGGQVRLPLVGPLITLSAVPRVWAAGLTELPSGARLLVSRGIGMEGDAAPRLRFLCRPELVVIDLMPRESEPDTR
jgi:hypothetical protein